jgi:hypothetical protein
MHLVIALVLAQSARALTVEIEADTTGIPVFGAFAGTAIVTNDSGASVRIAAPSMMLGSLRYEVKGRSETILVGASYCVSTSATPAVSLNAGESVRLPVYLMKSDGVYLFGEVGPVQVRCIVASDYESLGKSGESASKWLELLVTPEISSEQWRAYFSSVADVMFPFHFSAISRLDPSFSRFRGSRYFRSHVMYQDFSVFAFGNQQTPDLIAAFLHENQEFMSGADAATKMWEALSRGSYCFDGDECANGSYYLGR